MRTVRDGEALTVQAVAAVDVAPLIEALTVELAGSGYDESEMFGYSVDRLEASGVRMFGAFLDEEVVGIGGIELPGDGTAELKRFFVLPAHRGRGAASAIITRLIALAAASAVREIRLETGTEQHAAIRFYERHGFEHIARFGPYVASASSVCMARRVSGTEPMKTAPRTSSSR